MERLRFKKGQGYFLTAGPITKHMIRRGMKLRVSRRTDEGGDAVSIESWEFIAADKVKLEKGYDTVVRMDRHAITHGVMQVNGWKIELLEDFLLAG